ncbi:hypothetical protein hmeg3_07680 [Herbaspirillum sp. meg3]|uniref:acyltransferase family protein n=1 Tax=Herbaspirillum sp. meg3 TaxID=2025949 RepID=UPI000B9905D4|nr:acyltransferase family protein [Herbaspirillum sp. meg3]ASU38189.1 hypothetical protein hmeg3_07680 [Herbaspirillum sp. meg3]
MTKANHHGYRPDIDGLRAIAVCSVVFFHAFPDLVPGGFVGVDVFFVISGFLISQIIAGELLADSFSFREFYVRRIKRIFPALSLVLAATLVFGWFVLYPPEFRQLGRHVFAGSAFFSNFQLWSEAGYFDKAAELKPLLHLWSLGIEEQFYLLFPLLLIIGSRFRRLLVPIVVAVLVLSLLIGVKLTVSNGIAAFYSPASRIWELMAGSLLAISPMIYPSLRDTFKVSEGLNTAISFAGLALLVFSLLAIDRSRSFPGLWAAAPVLGTVLLIASGSAAVGNRLISNRLFVSIGLISYPLYLWHWPILAYLHIVDNAMSSTLTRGIAVVGSVALATITYLLVETPVRRSRAPRRVAAALLLIVACMGAIGILASTGLINTRLGSKPELQPIFKAIDDNDIPERNVVLHGKHVGMVAFIGDSFLDHYFARVRQVVSSSPDSLSAVFVGVGGCPPIPSVSRISDPGGCSKVLTNAYKRAGQEDIEVVVIGSAWHYFYPITARNLADDPAVFARNAMVYAEYDPERKPIGPGTAAFDQMFLELEKQVAALIVSGKRVYLVLPTPISDDLDPLRTVNRLSGQVDHAAGVSRATYAWQFAPVINQLRKISVKTGATVLNPAEELCDKDFCSAFTGADPIYKDVGHIRPFYVAGRIDVFDEALGILRPAK